MYGSGQNNNTINVFFGYDMTDKEYSYVYRGVKCTKSVEDKIVLDVLVDIDDVWTHAVLLENN